MALKAHQRALLPNGLARSTARVTERAEQLLAERFPLTATLLLADWERFLGLPDCDIGDDAGIDERQRYAANKLRMKPSLNR
ncbi:putative phage tail protein [Arsenophonus sp. PmNCSU2021_1]|uniref:putative phage tail protein n=1 Tax=Arsenophonus sp. PmNCSU2021_1 TaxID=3118989 RepID=UPI003FA56780